MYTLKITTSEVEDFVGNGRCSSGITCSVNNIDLPSVSVNLVMSSIFLINIFCNLNPVSALTDKLQRMVSSFALKNLLFKCNLNSLVIQFISPGFVEFFEPLTLDGKL